MRRPTPRVSWPGGAVLLLAVAAAAPGCALQRQGDHTVTMTDRQFAPAELRVTPGSQVAWHNASTAVHALTTDPAGAPAPNAAALPVGATPLRSGDVAPGGIWSRTLTVPGRYAYYCPYHREAGMIGTIVVAAGENEE